MVSQHDTEQTQEVLTIRKLVSIIITRSHVNLLEMDRGQVCQKGPLSNLKL